MEAFDQLAELYQGEHSHNPFQAALIERIDSLVPAAAPILDLGCGTGVPTAKIFTGSGHRVVGVDIAEGMLRLAREQVPDAEFVRADVRELPADFGPFGAVTAFFSLLMLSRADIEKTLTRIAGWLEPGGYLGLGMVNLDADSLPIEFLGVPVTVSGYPQDQLAARVTDAGFTVESVETVEFTPAGGPPESQIYLLGRLPG
ncbi:methyltransferase [Actinoplanes sp. NBRC 14428]|uniref:Methyltransferase family protein n=1 Tax=Pseudosporangium ferrugineum TaxID=439699 RepID=A0A2T0SI48_9ACTN|nr:class I SAM-dependent methyltransferase [Pseudosporangium ferrugineum]PRY33094.1 methyltransferase family protein [Pseudosporangium ferrugineum]BCJ48923.1 methyltransferase [Actinoplanes sp. NBRC 14428]